MTTIDTTTSAATGAGAAAPNGSTIGARENDTSFRAVPDHSGLASQLGPLRDLPGRWHGTGFNLIARPDFQGGNDIFLQLSRTSETLQFTAIGSPIPNRGSAQDDISLAGVHYLQQIADASPPHGALHLEPGIWLSVPATTSPPASASVVRLACIPHGDAVNASGQATSANGPPDIRQANTVPFTVGSPTPPPGTPNPFPEYDLAQPNPFRTNPFPVGITQAMVDDPNAALRTALVGLDVVRTETLHVSTSPSGGVANIAFVVANADAVSVSATFWIETVRHHLGHTHMQLQYTQTVLLNFEGRSWPHVTVATLTKTF